MREAGKSLTVGLLLVGLAQGASTSPDFGGSMKDNSAIIKGALANTAAEDWAEASAAGDPVAVLTEYKRMEQCEGAGHVYPAENGPCAGADGAVPLPDCGGYPPLLHLWRHTRPTADAPWGPWAKRSTLSCASHGTRPMSPRVRSSAASDV